MDITSFAHISDYPQDYSASNMLARMIEGVGFRYYWATEGLTTQDLAQRPCDSGRSISETLQHIHSILEMAGTAIADTRYVLPESNKDMPLDAQRQATLALIAQLRDHFAAASDASLAEAAIKFKMGDQDLNFPAWHLANGPFADVIYHTGQLVSLRRAAGNPMPTVNHFMGQGAEEMA